MPPPLMTYCFYRLLVSMVTLCFRSLGDTHTHMRAHINLNDDDAHFIPYYCLFCLSFSFHRNASSIDDVYLRSNIASHGYAMLQEFRGHINTHARAPTLPIHTISVWQTSPSFRLQIDDVTAAKSAHQLHTCRSYPTL